MSWFDSDPSAGGRLRRGLLRPLSGLIHVLAHFEDESTLRRAVAAIDALGIELHSPTPAIARDAARLRDSNISLADGFALATARARSAAVVSLDQRVRRAAEVANIELAHPGT